jgi:hypothetical protein
LRREQLRDGDRYVICESFEGEGCWKHRELMDLGADPQQYIRYPGGSSFYIEPSVEETLLEKGAQGVEEELEGLFLPFLEPRIRRIVERFTRSSGNRGRWKGLGREELMHEQGKLHSFDKRRLHYLRCGRVDIGDLNARPWKFLNILLEKSRDEIEHVLYGMEQELPPEETRRYLYTALEIQTHFRHLLTRHHPEMLDPEKVDHYFLEDLCRLNRDPRFFRGVGDRDPDVLHPYLVRYVIMYFDHSFDDGAPWADYVSDFMWRQRFHRPARSRPGWSGDEKEACRRLGITLQEFEKMARRDIVRCYRLKAKETHPDRGGEEEAFVRLKEAYECLLRRKH